MSVKFKANQIFLTYEIKYFQSSGGIGVSGSFSNLPSKPLNF